VRLTCLLLINAFNTFYGRQKETLPKLLTDTIHFSKALFTSICLADSMPVSWMVKNYEASKLMMLKKYAKMQHYFPHSGLPCCTFFRKLLLSWCWALAVVDIYAASYRFRDIRGHMAKMYVRNFGYCPQKGRRHVGIWCTIMHNFITIGCTVADICPRTDCRFSVTHRVPVV